MNRLLQQTLSAIALALLAPLLGAIATIIFIVDGRPILFRQSRIGYKRKPFTILKFRSMRPDADKLLTIADPTSRITKTGKWLRRTGLDELPQLLNIARGDMLFIGPRAVLPEVAANMPARFERRFDTLPGVTGLAQVSGRHQLLWSERLRLDVDYVNRRSLLLDLRILIGTGGTLLSGAGFSQDRTTSVTDDLGLLSSPKERLDRDSK